MLAEGPVGLRAAGPGDQRGAAGGGEGRAAHHGRRAGPRRARAGAPPPAAERAQRQLVRAHRLPQGHGARGVGARRPRRGARTRSSGSSPASGATACWWSCGTTATRSTVTATTRWPGWRWPSGSTSSPPTTCTTPRPRSARWPPRWRRCGHAAPSTRSTAGSRRRPSPTSAARRSRPVASPAGRVRSSAPSTSPQTCAFDLRLAAPELPDHDVPAGHTEMTWLRELTARGAARPLPVDALAPRAGDCARSPTSST